MNKYNFLIALLSVFQLLAGVAFFAASFHYAKNSETVMYSVLFGLLSGYNCSQFVLWVAKR